jgi:hypothetical protein
MRAGHPNGVSRLAKALNAWQRSPCYSTDGHSAPACTCSLSALESFPCTSLGKPVALYSNLTELYYLIFLLIS